MALPRAADVRFLLSRIRAGAEWGWKGGRANDFTRVDWRDGVQIEPTEAEYTIEQAVVDTEDTTKTATRAAIRARVLSAVGQAVSALTAAEFRAVTEELLFRFRALDRNGVIRPVDDWQV